MNIYRLTLLASLCSLTDPARVIAQRSVIWQETPGTWSLHVGLGPSRYFGDLNKQFDLAHLRIGAAMSVALTYRLTDQLAVRSDAQVYHIRGAHRNTRIAYNNLSFHSLNPDLSVGFQYSIWPSQDRNHIVVPYGIGGVGLTYMRPRAVYQGTTYSLAPLRTEGSAYNRLPLMLRYGIGIPLVSTNRLKGNVEGVYTHVLSDYLDDVSSRYADRSGMTPIAATLSDRAPEIGTAPNPAGAQRGNDQRNDGYLTLSARLIYLISTPRQRNYRRMFSR